MIALAAIACGSGGSQSAEVAPSPSVEAAGTIARFNWSGSLQPTRTRPSAVTSGSERNKAFGNVSLTASADDPRRSRAQITMNMPARQPIQLRWSLMPGRCGANALPVVGYEIYPIIEVNNTGRGQLDAMIPVALPTEGSYHVNVYQGGTDIDDVITCANLRMNRR